MVLIFSSPHPATLFPGQQQPNNGGPYPPMVWVLGGLPTISTDVPIMAVFLFLFIIAAIIHLAILIINLFRGHKFLLSGMLFGKWRGS
jgi:hypothetical protein